MSSAKSGASSVSSEAASSPRPCKSGAASRRAWARQLRAHLASRHLAPHPAQDRHRRAWRTETRAASNPWNWHDRTPRRRRRTRRGAAKQRAVLGRAQRLARDAGQIEDRRPSCPRSDLRNARSSAARSQMAGPCGARDRSRQGSAGSATCDAGGSSGKIAGRVTPQQRPPAASRARVVIGRFAQRRDSGRRAASSFRRVWRAPPRAARFSASVV